MIDRHPPTWSVRHSGPALTTTRYFATEDDAFTCAGGLLLDWCQRALAEPADVTFAMLLTCRVICDLMEVDNGLGAYHIWDKWRQEAHYTAERVLVRRHEIEPAEPADDRQAQIAAIWAKIGEFDALARFQNAQLRLDLERRRREEAGEKTCPCPACGHPDVPYSAETCPACGAEQPPF